MIGWYRDGADVERRLPLLSTWLGHTEPEHTYWYLSAVPELLELIADRIDAVAEAGRCAPWRRCWRRSSPNG